MKRKQYGKEKHLKVFGRELRTRGGFTLVELIIYVAIVNLVVVNFILFAISIGDVRNASGSAVEVQAVGRFTRDILARTVRESDGVITASSTFGAHPGVLVLRAVDSADDPIVIDTAGDPRRLRMRKGEGKPVFITSGAVSVTELVFRDLTGTSTRENIGIALELGFEGEGAFFDYKERYETSVSVRK